MLDAGHYGKYNQSPIVPEYYESKQMWQLCEYLAEELEKYGFEVGKTREIQETDLAVFKRGEKAKGYDLFISLHSNAVGSFGKSSVNRVDVYAPYDGINDSHALANLLAKAISNLMKASGGYVKTRKSQKGDWEYYGVLRGARSVGCPLYYIVEHSFHTNERSAKWLLNDKNLRTLAALEAAVIARYFGIIKDYELGDVNMNGTLDISDYVLIKRAYFGTVTLSDEQKKLADMDSDGKITPSDYSLAARKYMNK